MLRQNDADTSSCPWDHPTPERRWSLTRQPGMAKMFEDVLQSLGLRDVNSGASGGAWNAALAAACGDTMIWKPSPETPLTAIAVQRIAGEVMAANDCAGVFNLCLGPVDEIGERMIADGRLPLISATGSCRMGRRIGE